MILLFAVYILQCLDTNMKLSFKIGARLLLTRFTRSSGSDSLRVAFSVAIQRVYLVQSESH
jgi:hypothetical protein